MRAVIRLDLDVELFEPNLGDLLLLPRGDALLGVWAVGVPLLEGGEDLVRGLTRSADDEDVSKLLLVLPASTSSEDGGVSSR